MREGRARADRSFARELVHVVALAMCFAALVAGCATEVNTAEQPEPEAQSGGGGATSSGGKAEPTPAGGKGGTAGSKSGGGSGGSVINAFGGSASTGGKPTGGAPSSGGAGNGGSNDGGMGGKAAGGAGGMSGNSGTNGGGSGGSTGMSGSGGTSAGGAGGGLACLDGWQGGTCDTCSKQTQSDRLACVDILNCYAKNSCGPSSCANNDDKCGANKIGKGTAGYPIAKEVYDCSCP